jgi:hypothetical protein
VTLTQHSLISVLSCERSAYTQCFITIKKKKSMNKCDILGAWNFNRCVHLNKLTTSGEFEIHSRLVSISHARHN